MKKMIVISTIDEDKIAEKTIRDTEKNIEQLEDKIYYCSTLEQAYEKLNEIFLVGLSDREIKQTIAMIEELEKKSTERFTKDIYELLEKYKDGLKRRKQLSKESKGDKTIKLAKKIIKENKGVLDKLEKC